MSKKYDVIIIGAGPAGLFAGLSINGKKFKTLIIEKKQTPGKKLLLSGGGQCNFTNSSEIREFNVRYNNKNFVTPSLRSFSNNDLIDFLDKKCFKSLIRDDGKVFPESARASDLADLFVRLNIENGVDIISGTDVKSVSRDEECFNITTSGTSYNSRYLIIATGGKSYPQTGSDGTGFKLAEMLGHSITVLKPSLAPVFIKNHKLMELSGISFNNAKIDLYRNNTKTGSFTGELLITHKGFSGPAILNNSRYMENLDLLKISFTGKNFEETDQILQAGRNNSGKQSVKKFLQILNIPERLILFILNTLEISPGAQVSQLSREQRISLARYLSEYPSIINMVGDFSSAMATSGGVLTSEINKKTMESRICPGLYFAGEVLDIDGDTGGYNIQWAISSGRLAAMSISGTG